MIINCNSLFIYSFCLSYTYSFRLGLSIYILFFFRIAFYPLHTLLKAMRGYMSLSWLEFHSFLFYFSPKTPTKKLPKKKERRWKCNVGDKDEMQVAFDFYLFFYPLVANCWYAEVPMKFLYHSYPPPLFSNILPDFLKLHAYAWKELITGICMGSFYFHLEQLFLFSPASPKWKVMFMNFIEMTFYENVRTYLLVFILQEGHIFWFQNLSRTSPGYFSAKKFWNEIL